MNGVMLLLLEKEHHYLKFCVSNHEHQPALRTFDNLRPLRIFSQTCYTIDMIRITGQSLQFIILKTQTTLQEFLNKF